MVIVVVGVVAVVIVIVGLGRSLERHLRVAVGRGLVRRPAWGKGLGRSVGRRLGWWPEEVWAGAWREAQGEVWGQQGLGVKD